MKHSINSSPPRPGGIFVALLLLASSITAQQVELVSRNFAGTGSGDGSSSIVAPGAPVVALGRYVVFSSTATDLVANGPGGNFQNVYVRDLQNGTTELASPDYLGIGGANANVSVFKISGNGRAVVFATFASNLVPDDNNGVKDLFVRDLQTHTTTRVNVDVPARVAFNYHDSFSVSDDGRLVAFHTTGGNVSLPYDRNRLDDVYVWDVTTGRTRLVSVDRFGTRAGNSASTLEAISANGRYVLFRSNATNLSPEVIPYFNRNYFVRDLETNLTKLVSVTTTGGASQGNNFTLNRGASISADGRFVTFFSGDDNLVTNDHNGKADVFQRDMINGTTQLVSANQSGTNGGNQGIWEDFAASQDGRYVAFHSLSTDLIAGGTTGANCFVRDVSQGVTRLASRQVGPISNGSEPLSISISPNGRFVSFAIYLPPAILLYLDDALAERTQQVGGTSANDNVGPLTPVGFSDDGRFLVFYGSGTILPNDNNAASDVFVIWLGPSGRRPHHSLLGMITNE